MCDGVCIWDSVYIFGLFLFLCPGLSVSVLAYPLVFIPLYLPSCVLARDQWCVYIPLYSLVGFTFNCSRVCVRYLYVCVRVRLSLCMNVCK